MLFDDRQIDAYRRDGYLLLRDCFSTAEVDLLKAQLAAEFAAPSERRVLEKGGRVVRSVYGSHATNEVFRRLVRDPRLVEPIRQLLGSEVYVYQFKVNAKVAFAGDLWEWHQDYIFWLREDGVPEPRLVNVVIFLDEASEFNGPMFLIRSSHREGVVEPRPSSGVPAGYDGGPAWISNLTADLKYSIAKDRVAALASRYGMVSAKGPSGAVLFFHPNLLHGSAPNMSPFDRSLVIVTYNSVENLPRPAAKRRPWFLASEDCAPIAPSLHEALLQNPGVER
jgi:ectoine hydroxylase